MTTTTVPAIEIQPSVEPAWIEWSSKSISEGLAEALFAARITLRTDGLYQIDLPQLSPTVYKEFKMLLPLVRGYWNRSTHLAEYDPSDVFYEVATKGVLPKSNPGAFFPTPDGACDDLLEYMGFPRYFPDSFYPYMVLEPNGGTGNLIRAVARRNQDCVIHTFELDPVNQRILTGLPCKLIGQDFLKETAPEGYDFVVMNPPFKGREYIKHIMKAFQCLKIGGRLGAIVPDGMLRDGTKAGKAFRNFVAEHGGWEEIGSPFADTKVKCLQIKLERFAEEELTRLWSRQDNGYDSWFHEEIDIAVSCDRTFYSFVERMTDRREAATFEIEIGRELDATVERLITKENCCLVWNDKSRASMVKSIAQDIRDYG